ncbi:MAG: hypothetical protein AB1665_01170 [Candidatus Thermoplasmatota archaeon]
MLLLSEAKKLSDMDEGIKDHRERKIVIHAQSRAETVASSPNVC